MVEGSPPKKSDEQYPLLMVNGGGDAIRASQPQSALSSVWSVDTGRSKWRERWPEFLSACWMMVILLGISFLVFYVIGIIAYRTQPFLIVKCNNTAAAKDVYYFKIIERGKGIQLSLYTESLIRQAETFHNLRFNIFFLIDDALQSAFTSKHAGLFSKLIPSHNYNIIAFSEDDKRHLRMIATEYSNINVTIMPLSSFMAMTPYKYKWRNIPVTSIPFYARIFSVWQNGGIGIDFMTLTNVHDGRYLRSILEQHNNGITSDGYNNVFTVTNYEDDLLSLVFNLFGQIMSDTRSFINKTFPIYEMAPEQNMTMVEPLLVRTHRSKRDLAKHATTSPADNNSNPSVTQATVTGETILTSEIIVEKANASDKANSNITEKQTTQMDIVKMIATGPSKRQVAEVVGTTDCVNGSKIPQAVFIYDLVFASGNAGPFLFSDPISESFMDNQPDMSKNKNKKSSPPIFLTLESEGQFVAATTPLHPFLGYIVSSGCMRNHPAFVIKDAIMSKCPPWFREEYCNNIFII